MLIFKADYLAEAGKRIFQAAGAPDDIAAHVATSLVESNLVGHDSHGVIRIPTYVARARDGLYEVSGRPETLRETATTGVVSGNWGFGQVAATYATDLAIPKARAPDLGQLLRHIAHQARRIGITEQCRHGPHGETAAAERLEFEPHMFQRLEPLGQQRRRLCADVDNGGNQQPLAGDAAFRVSVPEPLEGDPLMGRMLIDDDQGLAAFANQIAFEHLSDDTQAAEESGGRRRGL